MDIDPLWALGGWFLILSSDCMAAFRTTPISEASAKPYTALLLLTVIFIILVLARPADQLRLSMAFSDSSPSAASTTANLRPKHINNTPSSDSSPGKSSPTSSRGEFEARAHEVPSGPNPISNK